MGWVPDTPVTDSPPVAATGKGKWVPDSGPTFPTGATEMRAGHPYLETAEKIGEFAAPMVGAIMGGPMAPMAAAVAMTGDQVLNALINHYVSNRPINLSPSNIEQAQLTNAAGSYAGEMLGPPIQKGLSSAASKVFGTEALGQAAQEAAAKAGTQQETLNKAAEQEVMKGTAARADAQNEFNYARQQAQTEASQQIGGLRDKVAGQLGPEARTAQIQTDIGRTSEATQAALAGNLEKTPSGTSLPGPQMVQRQQDFYHSVYGPIHKMSDAGGAQYDAFWKPHLNDAVDSTPLIQAAADERAYVAQTGKTFSPAINKLLARADPNELGGAVAGSARGHSIPPPPGSPSNYLGVASGTGQKFGALPAHTVSELRGLRSDASALVASATNGHDKAAAQNIVEAVDNTLDQSNILSPREQQTLQGLNAKWRSYKTIFDRSVLRKVGSSAEPVDSAATIFDDPKRSQLLLANADKDQLSTLRRTYADWVNRDGSKVIKPEHATALTKLFPGTPLANPKSWLYADAKLAKFQDVINSSPQIRQRFMQQYQSQLHDIQVDSAKQIVKAATQQAKGLGTIGEAMINNMRAAPDPIAAADIATKAMTGMHMQAAIPQIAVGMDRQAAIQSIQQGKMAGKGSLDWIKNHWPIYAAFTVWSLASGRTPSEYIGGMAGLGAVDAGITGIRNRYFRYLANNPAAATHFWEAISNPGTPSGFSKLAGLAAKAAVADATSGVMQQATGTTLEPESEGEPHTDDLIRSKAEALAPTSSASERADELTKGLYKNKKPQEIHQDLNRGRLSMEETNKILQDSTNPSLDKLVRGMPLSELLDDLEMATPQEREALMPAALERLKQELPQEKNKTLQANLSQRFQKIATGKNTGRTMDRMEQRGNPPPSEQRRAANGNTARQTDATV